MFEDKKARQQAMSSLASHSLQMHEIEIQKINPNMDKAEMHKRNGVTISNDINVYGYDIQTQISQCFVTLFDGQIKSSKTNIETVMGEAENNKQQEPLCLIAKAIIDFNEGNLQAALDNLKRVIDQNPCAPVDIWCAVGILYFKLHNLPKAKFALEHVLSLDKDNSMALTALAITLI